MKRRLSTLFRTLVALVATISVATAVPMVQAADEALPSIEKRFAPASAETGPVGDEVPNFQKHVSPLMGRLGCNGRACHGSFQGRGDFRLSLFGYDFEADHAALMDHGRVDREKVLESLILTKPVDDQLHEGGKRFEKGGWEYWVLRRWVEAKAPFDKQKIEKLDRLEVAPASMTLKDKGETRQLKVVAHWESGISEDVTSLCRFQTNDPSVVTIDERGLVTAGDIGDSHVVVSYDNAVVPVEVLRPYSNLNEQTYPHVASRTRVDELINAKLQRLGIVPSELCTDEEFLRRASLDVTGTLPTVQEVVAFAKDTSTDKRARKINELLERPGYAGQWATFFCDMTGNNDDQLRNFLPTQRNDLPATQWYQWIHQRLEQNVPYDDMVEGIVTAKSRLPNESYADYCKNMSEICQDASGEKFAQRPGLVHYWVRQNFRTPEEKAIGFAYTFLGVRIQCAQCHKHPFDQWTKADFENFERLFGGIQGNQNSLASDARKEYSKMVTDLGVDKDLKGNNLRKELALKLAAGQTVPFPELLVNARTAPDKKKVDKDKKERKNKDAVADIPKARLLGGEWVTLDQADVRGKLMDWLRSPENPYFAKALVNRVWAQYFSVGIVNPSDDLNLANAPSNAPLFDYLAQGFIEHNFDLKWLHREILSSDAYQRSWIVNETNRMDKRNFSHSQLRRLPAETAHDAVLMALANDKYAEEVASGKRPRALAVSGASAVVRGGDTSYALTVFGRSVRETNCDCDRSNEPSLLQTVFLLNDAAVQNWLCDPEQSWVANVAKEYGWTYKSRMARTPDNKDAKGKEGKDRAAMAADRYAQAKAQFDKQAQKLEQRLAEATSKGDQAQITTLNKRKQSMLQQLESLEKQAAKAGVVADEPTLAASSEPAAAKATSTASMSSDQARAIAEKAYLRSLSRLPNADEMAIAVNYLTGESDPAKAVEGLIWSIVNTKEFILNH